jgi:hypothetical protein
MHFFSAILLLNTLRALLEELEQTRAINPNSPALVQLQFTVRQQIAILSNTGGSDSFLTRIHGTA